jgi:protein involved in temperature-dependent protein secretion
MSYPTLFTTPGVKVFAEEIDAERARQIAKFGDQRHIDGTGIGNEAELAEGYRAHNELHEPSWQPILLEEVYEALAETDPAKLRAELLQVAAVCAAWIYDLDRR